MNRVRTEMLYPLTSQAGQAPVWSDYNELLSATNHL